MIQNDIRRVVLWGHKLHTHTHSYIHYGFEKAFRHLGYSTLWYDNDDDVSSIDFSNSLFITEGSVSKNIPIRNDCYYIAHNCDNKFGVLPKNRVLTLQVFTTDVYKYETKIAEKYPLCHYMSDCLFAPWATDLLPHEINENIESVKNNLFVPKTSKMVSNFVGYHISIWDEFRNECAKFGITLNSYGGYSGKNLESDINKKLIQDSIIAPALQSEWQVKYGYIPCRLFKNISYGKMGMTNSKIVSELFDNKIIYYQNINTLIRKGLEFENKPVDEKINTLVPLMELIRDNHTYLNRIDAIFWMFNEVLGKQF